MYRRILIATDGSRLAARGIRTGVRLARSLGARVYGVYVMLPPTPRGYDETAIYYAGVSARGWRHEFEQAARRALRRIELAARAARVPCETHIAHHPRPWHGILAEAQRRKCDAVVMSSHGHGGLGGLVLGSETTQLLARSRIPVLVVR